MTRSTRSPSAPTAARRFSAPASVRPRLRAPRAVWAVLSLALALAASAAAAGLPVASAHAAAARDAAWTFASQPALAPPAIEVLASAPPPAAGGGAGSPMQAPGYVFLAPIKDYALSAAFVGKPGPEIVEADGDPIWEHPLGGFVTVDGHQHEIVAMDFHAETYEGQPVLVWWQGYISPLGFGNGVWEIANDHYQVIATVRPPAGYELDFHDFAITPNGLAYTFASRVVPLSLTCCHGPSRGAVYDQALFEIDIKTHRVVWQWDALQHIRLRDSYEAPPSGSSPWDAYHLNSLTFGPSGAPIIGARNTWAAYWVDRHTGHIFATLGGKHSTFAFSRGAHFAWQHDVQQRAGQELSVFDDEAAPPEAKQSRGELLSLDWAHHRATLLSQYLLPHPALAGSQGSVQEVAGGNLFVGWGQLPYFSEYSHSGTLLYLGQLPGPDESYRTYKMTWTGLPRGRPALAVKASAHGADLFASWNGATQVAAWSVLAGRSPSRLARPASAAPVPRQGFQTTLATSSPGPYYAVQALDASGHVLATSAPAAAPRPKHKRPATHKR